MADYNDGNIECTANDLKIHGYYFPWGTKVVPYRSIKAVQRVDLGPLRGKLRIWGTGNMKYWANLDTKRPKKNDGIDSRCGQSRLALHNAKRSRHGRKGCARACRTGPERRVIVAEPVSLVPELLDTGRSVHIFASRSDAPMFRGLKVSRSRSTRVLRRRKDHGCRARSKMKRPEGDLVRPVIVAGVHLA